MTVLVADMQARFPEFANAGTTLIQSVIDEATRRTPLDIWGTLQDDGVKMLAADLLAQSPFAAELKLIDKNGDTRYGMKRRELEGIVACGPRVTGDTSSWLG